MRLRALLPALVAIVAGGPALFVIWRKQSNVAPLNALSRLDQAYCVHGIIPTRVGSWRRYASVTHGASESQNQIEFRVTEAAPPTLAEPWRLTWTLRIADDLGSNTNVHGFSVVRRCWSGVAAEDPWSAVRPSPAAEHVEDELWRWPVELRAGLVFSGRGSARVRGGAGGNAAELEASMLRTHTIEGKETLQLSAGSFETWRVNVVDQTSSGDERERSRGTFWLAQDIGLVRSVMQTRGRTAELRLIAYGER